MMTLNFRWLHCSNRRRLEGDEPAKVLQAGPAKLGNMQRLTVELIPDTEQGGFTARVPDIPSYGEGSTEDEAIADLREALLAYVEEFGVEDAMARLNQPSALRPMDVELDPIHA